MSPDRPDTRGRAVNTGVGLHGCFGDEERTWQALCAGETGIEMRGLPGMDGLAPVPVARSDDPQLDPYLPDRKLLKYMSPTARMAVAAAGRALASAGLLGDAAARRATALLMAVGFIAFDFATAGRAVAAARDGAGQLDLRRLGRDGLRASSPLMPFQMLLNMPLGMTSIALGLGGHNFVLYPGAAAAASCLEGAVRAIEQGRLTRILVGGTAQGVSLLPLGTAIRLERLAASPSAAQPFSPRHRGWAAADGAACVLLESAATARERGCQPLAEVGRPALRRSAAGAPLSAGARQRLWAEVCGERPPDLVMASGRVDSEGDGAALAAVEAIWPAQPVRLTSADGALGHPGPAAAVQSLALSALMIARHRTLGVPSLTGIPVSPRVLAGAEAPAPQRILLSIEDPDGAEAAVALAEADR